VIWAISETLERFLRAAIPEVGANGVEVVTLHGGDAPAALPAKKLVLCLWAVGEEGHLRNRGPVPVEGGYVPAPLALRLSYLLTVVSDDAEEVQKRLERVAQVFHGKPRLGPEELSPALLKQVAHLTVRLRTLSLEELNQLWTAFGRGMRLALYYDVAVALIAAEDPEPVGPVRRRELALAEAVRGGGA
jgi:hypothetical protein